MHSWYLICYDIHDEKRLRKVATLLEGYGYRLQLSIFRCQLTERSIERLRWELAQLLSPDDGLLIVPLCGKCVSQLKVRDSRGQWPEEPAHFTVV